jgi:hypothetical protein
MQRRLIGLDLDNTIIDYERAFAPVAEEIGLIPKGTGLASKEEIKAALRGTGGEEAWMRLQGQLYGRYIERATLYPGVADFVSAVMSHGAKVVIVSHKTRFGHFDAAGVDLHQAALGWLDRRGFFTQDGLDRADVYFEETRSGKLARIAEIGCDLFVDDLPEIFHDPGFPRTAGKLWFAGDRPEDDGGGLKAYRNWGQLLDIVMFDAIGKHNCERQVLSGR